MVGTFCGVADIVRALPPPTYYSPAPTMPVPPLFHACLFPTPFPACSMPFLLTHYPHLWFALPALAGGVPILLPPVMPFALHTPPRRAPLFIRLYLLPLLHFATQFTLPLRTTRALGWLRLRYATPPPTGSALFFFCALPRLLPVPRPVADERGWFILVGVVVGVVPLDMVCGSYWLRCYL